MLLALSVLVAAAIAPRYTAYVNDRFHYVVSYPAALLVPQGEAANGDGQRFLSHDGKTEMAVWGQYNALDDTIESRLGAHARGVHVTFKRLAKDWFAFSGTRGETVLYEKTILKGGTFVTVALSYPAAEKARWDPVAEVVSKSLRVSNVEGGNH